MKIGILTVPFNNNYGGYLQAFALMQTLTGMGHHPILINRRQNIDLSLVSYLKAWMSNRLLGKKERVYNRKTLEGYYEMKGRNMLNFVKKRISPSTPPIYSKKESALLETLSLDAVIVGSDQVWRPQYVPDIYEYFLGHISNDIIRIAYAASFGTDQLEYDSEELSICKKLLASFKAVSVRENSGSILLEKYFNYNRAKTVLDPTMLLGKDDYLGSFEHGGDSKSHGIFAYILDKSEGKDKIITKLSRMCGEPVIDIMSIPKYAAYHSIEDWLKGIYDAKIVITDSFHGTVFSILFNKPFYVINNHKRGNSRIIDLLSACNLINRLISEEAGISKVDYAIDWNYVNQQIILRRQYSMNFLIEALQ